MHELDDRIVELCTQIGMLMEDASAVAVTIAGLEPAERAAEVDRLGIAVGEITNLLRQARELLA